MKSQPPLGVFLIVVFGVVMIGNILTGLLRSSSETPPPPSTTTATPISTTGSLPPMTETITIAEDDLGCLDKTITEAAMRKPLQWEPNPNGRKGFYLPFADAFSDSGGKAFGNEGDRNHCIYWLAGDRADVQQRDGDLACLQRTSKCYWTAVARPPSKRAGPMPGEASKPLYEQSLTERANEEIDEALNNTPGYKEATPEQKLRYRVAELRKQAAQYAHESNDHFSNNCDVPTLITKDGTDAATQCESSWAEFQRDYGLALRGDYQAQQNVAVCFRSEKICFAVVRKNAPLGCAWQLVSLASGNKRVTQLDIGEYQMMCVAKLTSTEMVVSRTQAEALFQRIYHKPLTPSPLSASKELEPPPLPPSPSQQSFPTRPLPNPYKDWPLLGPRMQQGGAQAEPQAAQGP